MRPIIITLDKQDKVWYYAVSGGFYSPDGATTQAVAEEEKYQAATEVVYGGT